ncbi:MAG: ATP-binding protein [Burkholderiales bacterium]
MPQPPLLSAPMPETAPRRMRRASLWVLLIALVVTGQVALWWLTWKHEHNRAQDATDAAAMLAAGEIRQTLADDIQALQQLAWEGAGRTDWRTEAQALLRERREIMRVERRTPDFGVTELVQSAYHGAQFSLVPRSQMLLDAEAACAGARRFETPTFSRPYFMPISSGIGVEVMDLCILQRRGGRETGWMLATVVLGDVLDRAVPPRLARSHEITLVDSDGARLARLGLQRGAGTYTAERVVDVGGFTQPLRLNSYSAAPTLLPSLSTALTMLLSLALLLVLGLLVRDVRRRGLVEQHLADALSFRNAMEDSLVTGLRACDMAGRITYANQAFCRMVDYTPDELLHVVEPPCWPPDLAADYAARRSLRQASSAPSRDGFETVFMRRNGERFPVMIFEAPLVDGRGRQTGWMSTVLDVSAQRRAEELTRQQQDKLQAAARLATVGEMASLLSHELNQPLAAIASYAHGSLNLLPEGDTDAPVDPPTQHLVRQAVARIAEQAERAGRVIGSVHQFVRRRERLRENLRANELIDAVLPLVRLAAQRAHIAIAVELPDAVPRVSCDRTMVEQVLLNLARNGLQAMEAMETARQGGTAAGTQVLTLAVHAVDARWVAFSVRDRGPGIAPEVARQLFTPFFSTKPQGMGIGLAMCRTVVEQHGGALEYTSPAWPPQAPVCGTEFTFTLPAAVAPSAPAVQAEPSDAAASTGLHMETP